MQVSPHRLLKGIINNAKPDCSHGLKPKSKLTPHMPLPSLTIAHAHAHCPLTPKPSSSHNLSLKSSIAP